MKNVLSLITLLLLMSCNTQLREFNFTPPPNWKVIKVCNVSFSMKPDFKQLGAPEVDSCYKEYRNPETIIALNVANEGGNSLKDGLSWKKDFQIEKVVVKGRYAELITYYDNLPDAIPDKYSDLYYAAVLYVPNFFKSNNLTFGANSKTHLDRNEAIKILQSVNFNNE